MQTYNVPIIPRVKLTVNSKCNIDKSIIGYAEIDIGKIGRCGLFNIADVTKVYTVIRLDILESMLKRNVKGLNICEIDTVNTSMKKYWRCIENG